jgi:hypothetical protein
MYPSQPLRLVYLSSNIVVAYSLANHHRLLAYIRSNLLTSCHFLGPEMSTNNTTKNRPHPHRHGTINSPVHKHSHRFEAAATFTQSQDTHISRYIGVSMYLSDCGNGCQTVVDAHEGICKSGSTWCVEGRQPRGHVFILACGDLNTSSDGVQDYSGKLPQATVQWLDRIIPSLEASVL